MFEKKLMFTKCLKLVFAIILIFEQISNSFGSENPTGICLSLTSTTSTNVKCAHNGIHLQNCEEPKDGTTVLISCNPFYEEHSLQENPIRICTDGKWNSPIPECYPICGQVTSKAAAESDQLLSSTNVHHDYPWQIGIYSSSTKDFICGGSIINPKIILTAAHCITDSGGSIKPSENYVIAAGKYNSNYVDERDEYAQYSKVSEIHVSERYRGFANQFTSDIAILTLREPFTLSIAVQPVCVESNEQHNDLNILLDSNSVGIVTGWGYIKPGGPLAEVLKVLTIPYIPFDKCFLEVPTAFRRYITFDKICGGYLNNGTSICTGDAGGGFVFKNVLKDRYYIKAVASVSLVTENSECDMNQYALYTSVSHHITFVESLMGL